MEHVLASFFFHVFFAIIFSLIYYWIGVSNFQFSADNYRQPTYTDFLSFSTSIQAGVGISNLNPNTELCNIILTIQQFLLIATNVFLVYIIFKKR